MATWGSFLWGGFPWGGTNWGSPDPPPVLVPYTKQDIDDALRGKTAARHVSYRYDLLDSSERKIKTLTTVSDASIAMSAFADIKKTAKFKLRDDPDINYASHRIQPFFVLGMPDGSTREWPLGIFLLSSPKRQESNGYIYRDIEAYDGLQVLKDDKFENRYFVAAGTNYITAIKTILTGAGITKINLEASTLTLPAGIEFEPGATKLAAVGALLDAINYISLYVDPVGYYTSRTYVSATIRPVTYTYADDELSVLYNGLTDETDLFDVPNKFVAYTSNPDASSLRSVYSNTNPLSQLSTVSRGRTITDVRKVDDIADQTSLDAYVARVAFEASQVYGYITMQTAVMPFHDVNDVVRVEFSPLYINENFSETNWSFRLKAGEKMTHKLRRTVNIL